MSERVVMLGPERELMGILTEAEGGSAASAPAAVLFNAGFLPRMGPNRLHVRLARRLAGLGIPSLRFDLSGLGDSPPSRSLEPAEVRFAAEARQALDVATRELSACGVVPVGMCTGAGLVHRLALEEEGVVGAVMINGGLVDPAPADEVVREAQARLDARYYRRQLHSPTKWLRVLRGESDLRTIGRTIGRAARRALRPELASEQERGTAPERDLGELRRLRERGVATLAIYADGSLSWDLLCQAYGPKAAAVRGFEEIELHFMESCDHVFTPRQKQEELLTTIGAWFARRWPRGA